MNFGLRAEFRLREGKILRNRRCGESENRCEAIEHEERFDWHASIL